jgi:hypothetical protein
LAHAHHLFPLAMQFDCGVERPVHEHSWLCPTHHAAIHVKLRALVANRWFAFPGMPPAEIDALDKLGVRFVALWVGARQK